MDTLRPAPVLDDQGRACAIAGNVPGTDHSGVALFEPVSIERNTGGVWSTVAENLPATFEPIDLTDRIAMQAWTHRVLLGLWLLPDAPLRDGDRVVRSDGSKWVVRGAPLLSPARTHLVALTQSETDDSLFGTGAA